MIFVQQGNLGGMLQSVAEDDGAITLADAEALIGEIDRLRGEVAKLEARVARLDQLANRDPLADLPNRRGFLVSLERLIARVERYGGPAAMLFVDLDGLKTINDSFGHKAGDQALLEVAQRLVSCVRESDCVARIGGDEFGVLLEHADELSAWQTALRVVEVVAGAEFCVDGTCLPLSVAVGVAEIRPGDNCQSVMDRADKEMYRVKGT
jgi:diguanylate cyclase (GGDEF)-like protein